MEEPNNEASKILQNLIYNKDNPIVLNLNSVPQDPQKIAESAEKYIAKISNLTQREIIIRSLGKIETLRNILSIGIYAAQKMQSAEHSYYKIALQSVEEIETLLLWVASKGNEQDLFAWISTQIFGIELAPDSAPIQSDAQEQDEIEDDEL